MSRLQIMDLYDQNEPNRNDVFSQKTDSKMHVSTSHNKVEYNLEWLDKMEETIRYLDNILRNPNRFIVNEEEVIKIEMARKIGVESIKHLSRNTNLIQEYDRKTGDVKPSKILNINKEESYNTYENRFIYSLIQNMKLYIAKKKNFVQGDSSYKGEKKIEYTATSSLGSEKVNISLNMQSKIDESKVDDSGPSFADRISKLELQISDLTNSEVYKTLAKLHVAMVTSPIKKTNVILKNVNFQYAVSLWNYLQEHVDDDTIRDDKAGEFDDDGKFKKYLDESFLLNYLVMNSIDQENTCEVNKVELTERLVGNMVEKLVDLDIGMTEEQLKDVVARQYTVIKYKSVVNDKKIQEIFKNNISKYLDKINEIKI